MAIKSVCLSLYKHSLRLHFTYSVCRFLVIRCFLFTVNTSTTSNTNYCNECHYIRSGVPLCLYVHVVFILTLTL